MRTEKRARKNTVECHERRKEICQREREVRKERAKKEIGRDAKRRNRKGREKKIKK